VWYVGAVPTVWYFGAVPTVWYFLLFILLAHKILDIEI
jgi:hypothetical protein